MKAIRISEHGAPEVLHLEEADDPTPAPGQVLIEVAAAGVTFIDVMKRQGVWRFGRVELPMILGGEAAGTVAAVGGDAAVGVGERVIALVEGGYAEYALASAGSVVPLPDELGVAEATAPLLKGGRAELILRGAGR